MIDAFDTLADVFPGRLLVYAAYRTKGRATRDAMAAWSG